MEINLRPAHRRSWVPYIVLVTSLLVAAAVAFHFESASKAKEFLRFQNQIEKAQNDIVHRVDTYVALLRAGSAVYTVSPSFNQEKFQKFVDRLQIQERYPGIQGIGFAKRVKRADKESHLAFLKRESRSAKSIWPEVGQAEFYTIIYLEPQDRRNIKALGYDMFSEPVRRAAMEKARDTGAPVASGKVTLVQEIDKAQQAGFLIFLPVYRGGFWPEHVEDRRKNIEGFVYSPFRADDLLQGIFGQRTNPQFLLEVYDGAEVRAENILHRSVEDSAGPEEPSRRLQAAKTINIAGRPWTILFKANPSFQYDTENELIPLIWLGGLSTGFILFFLSFLQTKSYLKSLRHSQALLESEARKSAVLDAALDCIISSDHEGRITEFNPAAEKMFGYKREEVIGRNMADYIIPPRYREAHRRGMERYLKTGDGPVLNRRVEMTALRSDRTEFPIELAISRIPIEGLPQFTAYIRDITESKKAAEELALRMRQLQQLYSLTATTNQSSSLAGIYEEALTSIMKLVNADRVSILLFDPDGVIRFKAWKGLSDAYRKAVEGHSPWMVNSENPQPILVEDIQTHAGMESFRPVFSEEGIRSLAFFPLVFRGRLLGKFMVYFNNPHAFTEEEQQVVRTVGHHVAFAIDRQNSHDELQKSHNLIRAVFEGTTDSVYVKDSQGRYLMINPAGARFIGKSVEEIIGKDDSRLFSPDTAAGLMADDRRIMATGQTETFEDKGTAAGATRVYLSTKGPYRDHQGAVSGVIGISRDVTAQKKAEQTLRESEERFRHLAESTNVIPWEADMDTGQFTYVGPQATKVLGYPPEEWYATDFWRNHIHPDDRQWVAQFCIESSQKSSNYEFECRMFSTDGRTIWLRDIVSVNTMENGKRVLRGFLIDITDDKRARQKIEESEARFRVMADTAPVLIWMAGTDQKCVWFNKPWLNFTGRSLAQEIGEGWLEGVHPDDLPKCLDIFFSSFNDKKEFKREFRLKRFDGEYRWILDNGVPRFGPDGQFEGYIGSSIEIHDRKTIEQTLTEQAEQLFRSNKELEQFAFVSSHDLKEPLRKVASYAQLLEIENKGKLSPDADKYIANIVDGADRMRSLIEDLLAFSRLGRSEIRAESVDLGKTLEQTLSDLERSIEESKAAITHDPLPAVLADASQMGQLFLNLISNAIKFRKSDPLKIHIGAEQRDNEWVFSVRDNGIGFDPKYSDQIFKVFQRLHGKDRYPGTGIGLAICKKILDRHGGRIWTQSELGKGSTFYFSLPLDMMATIKN